MTAADAPVVSTPSPFILPGEGSKSGPGLKQSATFAPVAEMERRSATPAPVREVSPDITADKSRRVVPIAPAASQLAAFAQALTVGGLAMVPAASPAGDSNANPAANPVPQPEAGDSPTADSLRNAVVSALADAGHASASQLLGTGAWILDGSSLRIEVAGMGKKMLSLTVNAAAEKIIRQELQRMRGPARFMVVAGDGAGPASAALATPQAGSIQEAALAHPLVQRAKEIFNAEVRSVVDLRTK